MLYNRLKAKFSKRQVGENISSSRATSQNDARAFTLIELLVVISIISLLVSILLPSLTKAKELARTVTCSSKLRNVALGHTLYAQDNNGMFYYGNFGGLRLGAVDWRYPDYYPYVRTKDEVEAGGYLEKTNYYCPNFLGNLSPYHDEAIEWAVSRISYCMFANAYLDKTITLQGSTPDGDHAKRRLDSLSNVSPSEAMAQDIYADATGGGMGAGLRAGHETGANVLFTDAHVDFVGADQLTQQHNTSEDWYIQGTWWMYPEKM